MPHMNIWFTELKGSCEISILKQTRLLPRFLYVNYTTNITSPEPWQRGESIYHLLNLFVLLVYPVSLPVILELIYTFVTHGLTNFHLKVGLLQSPSMLMMLMLLILSRIPGQPEKKSPKPFVSSAVYVGIPSCVQSATLLKMKLRSLYYWYCILVAPQWLKLCHYASSGKTWCHS